MFALLDCNNFFVSCEKAFNPKLATKPVVVLSNNDGCIISRSQEAKDLKIAMGSPIYKCREIIKRYDVEVFSANFSLYGDMSNRIMKIISEYTPELEIYSIDEAFFSLNLGGKDLTKYCVEMRRRILKGTGIPVSIGIAPTKSLAKVCNHIAKKNRKGDGVFNWLEVLDHNELLKKIPVEDIWGVGRKSSEKLNKNGIYDALTFRDYDKIWIRKNMSVVGERIALELNGISCLKLDMLREDKKAITSSRSFGTPITQLKELEEAVATYVTRAAEKLRQQKSQASFVYVSIKTNKHRLDLPQYFNNKTITLNHPTSYTQEIISKALIALREIYKEGYRYKKATVILLGLAPDEIGQTTLFDSEDSKKKSKNIMIAIDKINRLNGSESIKYLATGLDTKWKMKKEFGSKRYTTSWNELLEIKL